MRQPGVRGSRVTVRLYVTQCANGAFWVVVLRYTPLPKFASYLRGARPHATPHDARLLRTPYIAFSLSSSSIFPYSENKFIINHEMNSHLVFFSRATDVPRFRGRAGRARVATLLSHARRAGGIYCKVHFIYRKRRMIYREHERRFFFYRKDHTRASRLHSSAQRRAGARAAREPTGRTASRHPPG